MDLKISKIKLFRKMKDNFSWNFFLLEIKTKCGLIKELTEEFGKLLKKPKNAKKYNTLLYYTENYTKIQTAKNIKNKILFI